MHESFRSSTHISTSVECNIKATNSVINLLLELLLDTPSAFVIIFRMSFLTGSVFIAVFSRLISPVEAVAKMSVQAGADK